MKRSGQFRVSMLIFVSVMMAVSIALADEWTEDYNSALKKAAAEKKMVLIDFTGSDWCGWCIKLDKEVFSKNDFKSYAKKNLILLKIDFPRSKPQSASLKKQNQGLQQKFAIQGYPTVIVLDDKGEKVGELGYMEGGPKAFIGALDKLKK